MAIIGAAAMVVGTVLSIKEQRKAGKEAKKANQFERQKASLQSARQKMEAVREGRRALAEVQQNAENQGVSGSSVGQGGAGSVYSQTNSNLSFLDRYGYYSDQATRFLQKAANSRNQAGMWQSVAAAGEKVLDTSMKMAAAGG
jgi:hypothetical protein